MLTTFTDTPAPGGTRIAPSAAVGDAIGPVTATVSAAFSALGASAPWPISSLQVRCPRVRIPGLGGDAMLVSNGLTTLGLVLSTTYTAICDQWGDDPAAGMLCVWTISPTIGSVDGASAWTLSSTDQFVAADLDGDGVDELFVWNEATGAAVLKWETTGFYLATQEGRTLPAGPSSGGVTWVLSSVDQIYAADVDGDGSEELVLLNPYVVSSQVPLIVGRAGVARWTGGTVELLSYSAGSIPAGAGGAWVLAGDEQVQTPSLGGGAASVLLSSSSGAKFGVANWNAGAAQLQMDWLSGETVPGDSPWPVDATDVYVTARLDGVKDYLVLFSPTLPTVGVASWSDADAQFEMLWSNAFRLGTNGGLTVPLTGAMLPSAAALAGGADWVLFATPGMLAAGSWDGTQLLSQWQSGATVGSGSMSWTPGSGDQYLVVSAGSAGTDRVLAVNGGANSVAQFGWDGTAMAVPWLAVSNFPGWSGSVLAGGPSTSFASFADDAGTQAAYVYISNYLWDQADGDIRAAYDSANIDDGTPMTWATALPGIPCPSDIPQDAWDLVVAVLRPEMQAVSGSRTYYSTLMKVPLSDQQLSDLSVVGALIPPVQQPESKVTYWVDQVLEALVWVAAAATGSIEVVGAGVAAGLSGGASLFGSYLGSPDNNGAPYQVPYEQLNGKISDAYVAAFRVATSLSDACAIDAIKGPLMAAMAAPTGTWNITLLDESKVPDQIKNPDQVAFFQLLLPAAYQISVWENCDKPYPTKLTGNKWQPEGPLGSPSYTYWAAPVGSSNWNVYLLWTGADSQEYPPQAMMTLLFETLGVEEDDFFLGRGAWSAIANTPPPGIS